VLVRSDDGAIDEAQAPIQPAFAVGLSLQCGQHAIPDAGLLPPMWGFCGGSSGRSRSHCASVKSLDFMV
jgi:hypothetical protein